MKKLFIFLFLGLLFSFPAQAQMVISQDSLSLLVKMIMSLQTQLDQLKETNNKLMVRPVPPPFAEHKPEPAFKLKPTIKIVGPRACEGNDGQDIANARKARISVRGGEWESGSATLYRGSSKLAIKPINPHMNEARFEALDPDRLLTIKVEVLGKLDKASNKQPILYKEFRFRTPDCGQDVPLSQPLNVSA